MTNKQFSAALTRMGVTQQGFAETIRVNDRTVRNWVSGRSEVPTAIAMLVKLMLSTGTALQDLKA
jgi:DNA-binding transcriptional regulator YiaG